MSKRPGVHVISSDTDGRGRRLLLCKVAHDPTRHPTADRGLFEKLKPREQCSGCAVELAAHKARFLAEVAEMEKRP